MLNEQTYTVLILHKLKYWIHIPDPHVKLGIQILILINFKKEEGDIQGLIGLCRSFQVFCGQPDPIWNRLSKPIAGQKILITIKFSGKCRCTENNRILVPFIALPTFAGDLWAVWQWNTTPSHQTNQCSVHQLC